MFTSKYISKIALGTILFMGSFSLLSCEKFVEIDRPVNTIGTESVFNSDDKAISALSGMYTLMINQSDLSMTNGAQTVLTTLLSDEGVFLNPGGQNELSDYYNAR